MPDGAGKRRAPSTAGRPSISSGVAHRAVVLLLSNQKKPQEEISDMSTTFFSRAWQAATRRWLAAMGFAAVAALGCTPAVLAEEIYPTRPITMVVPFPPGGSTDVAARFVAQHMEKSLGQPITILNRPGAAGAIGIGQVSRAAPDGYVLGVSGVGPSVLLAELGQELTYNPENDLMPVGMMGALAFVIAGNPNFAPKTLAEFLTYAKEHPGKVTYGTSGLGTPGHVAMESLKLRASAKIEHVPYKGNAPMLNDLLGGHVDVGVLTVAGTAEQVRSKSIIAYAVTGNARVAELPDVPTVSELGFPGYSADIWNVLVAPRGTPEPIIAKLNAALMDAMRVPSVQAQFSTLGFTSQVMTIQETADFVKAERKKWRDMVKSTGIQLK